MAENTNTNANTGNKFTLNFSGDEINKILQDAKSFQNEIESLKSNYGSAFPVGTVIAYAGEIAPDGWLLCNGAELNRTQKEYSALYKVIKTTYGDGDGSTTFNIPNLSGRVPIGVDNQAGYGLGDFGGEYQHILEVEEMPSHTHTTPCYYAVGQDSVATGYTFLRPTGYDGDGDVSINKTGGSQPHNNMQPYVVMNYIIKF